MWEPLQARLRWETVVDAFKWSPQCGSCSATYRGKEERKTGERRWATRLRRGCARGWNGGIDSPAGTASPHWMRASSVYTLHTQWIWIPIDSWKNWIVFFFVSFGNYSFSRSWLGNTDFLLILELEKLEGLRISFENSIWKRGDHFISFEYNIILKRIRIYKILDEWTDKICR